MRTRHIASVLAVSAVVAMACSSGTPVATTQTSVSTVNLQDFYFSPATLSVSVGTVVQWVNHGPSAHTATSDDGVWDSGQLVAPSSTPTTPGSTPPMSPPPVSPPTMPGYARTGAASAPGGVLHSMNAMGNTTYQFTFGTTGTYRFHCSIHPPASYPTFVGTVTVTN
jgi:plastocyanin